MRPVDSIAREEIIELLNKCWMTHDGMWFYHCLQEFGIAATNKLNKSAIKSLASIEVKRIKKVLGLPGGIDNFSEFMHFFNGVSKLMIPDFMNVRFAYSEGNKVGWVFKQERCFAYAGIKRLGVIDKYECGVLYRIKCWLQELEIEHQFNPEIGKCIMHQSGICSGEIQLLF